MASLLSVRRASASLASCCNSASQSHAGISAAWSCRTPRTKALIAAAHNIMRVFEAHTPRTASHYRRSFGNNRIMQHNNIIATVALALSMTASHQQQHQHQQLYRQNRHRIVAAPYVHELRHNPTSICSHSRSKHCPFRDHQTPIIGATDTCVINTTVVGGVVVIAVTIADATLAVTVAVAT